jgi:hypothetical protein
MRKERQFVNGDYQRATILLSGYDELGNNCVVTSDLLYYQVTEEAV